MKSLTLSVPSVSNSINNYFTNYFNKILYHNSGTAKYLAVAFIQNSLPLLAEIPAGYLLAEQRLMFFSNNGTVIRPALGNDKVEIV